MRKKILLIDASGLLFRAYFAMMKNPLRTKNGQPTSAVFGFLRMIFNVIKKYPSHMVIAAFDVPRSSLERTKYYSQYKATRKATPDDLIQQIPLAKECLQLAKMFAMTKEGYEADDVLASLVEYYKSSADIIVFTGDKDLLQLVQDHVLVAWPDKTKENGVSLLDREGVYQYKGIYPEEIPDYLAILGDTSDNIPGIKGIGQKGAQELITTFHSLSNVYAHLSEIKPSLVKKLEEYKADGLLSLELIQLTKDLPLDFPDIPENMMSLRHLVTPEFISKLEDLELFSLLKELSHIKDYTANDTNMLFPSQEENIDAKEFTFDSFNVLSESKGVGIQLEGDVLHFSSSQELFCLVSDRILEYSTALTVFLKALSDEQRLIVFDQKKLIHFLDGYGIILPFCHDLKMMAYLLDSARSSYSPEYLSWSYLGKNDRTPRTFYELKNVLERKIIENGMGEIYYHMEMPLRPLLASIEKTGVRIDKQLLGSISKELHCQLLELEQKIYYLAGQEFNILSPKQLGKVLFEDLGLNPHKKTKTKSYSTDEESLGALSFMHPLPKEVLTYRSLSKFKSTYTDSLPKLVDDQDRLHTTFHQTVTATGRLSSGDPNLQNIPIRTELGKKIRSAFIASKGKVLVSADYSQIELRLFASLSKDDKMRDFFLSGGDVHRHTASEVFGIVEDQVTSDQRRAAKIVNYGISYGMSAFRLSNELSIDFSEAKQFIDTYFQTFPGIQKFMVETLEFAHKNGFVKTLFGRRRFTPELQGKPVDKLSNLSHSSRFAINAVLQGTAADIIKKAMLQVQELILQKYNNQAEIILQVHDELLFEVDKIVHENFQEDLVRVMSSVVSLDVELEVSVGSGDNWMAAH